MAVPTAPCAKRVIIIGAGWAGLAAAKTYLEIDPTIELTIIDADRTLGGVWSADRIYNGLTTDSPVGMFDFSDLPMGPVLGQENWTDVPAQKVYDYLYAYSDKFKLLQRMRLSTTVSDVSRTEGDIGWDVTIQPTGEVLKCDKLLIATGIASKPRWPDVKTAEFGAPVMHSKEIGLRHSDLEADKVERVTVYGGCKSAVDAIVMCIEAGKKVDWVIRTDGSGAGMLVEARKKGYHGLMFMGRWKSTFMPSMYRAVGLAYGFLHSGNNRFGRWISTAMLKKMGATPFGMEPYKTKSDNIQKLMPEVEHALWQTASVNVLHGHKEFLRQLHEGKNIVVHRASITSTSNHSVQLSNGSTFKSDAIVFATGWEYSTSFLSSSLALELGLPAPLAEEDVDSAKYWENLNERAKTELAAAYPFLTTAPKFNQRTVTTTPFRLWRHLVPRDLALKHDRSLVILGMLSNLQYAIYSEVSALWSVSWMEGLLPDASVPAQEELDFGIAKFNTWSAMRYLSRGRSRMVAGGEIQDIIDMLMQDMGLKIHRKTNFISDFFVPYQSQDYLGIAAEMGRKKSLRE